MDITELRKRNTIKKRKHDNDNKMLEQQPVDKAKYHAGG
jgi:hypothetical protein